MSKLVYMCIVYIVCIIVEYFFNKNDIGILFVVWFVFFGYWILNEWGIFVFVFESFENLILGIRNESYFIFIM